MKARPPFSTCSSRSRDSIDPTLDCRGASTTLNNPLQTFPRSFNAHLTFLFILNYKFILFLSAKPKKHKRQKTLSSSHKGADTSDLTSTLPSRPSWPTSTTLLSTNRSHNIKSCPPFHIYKIPFRFPSHFKVQNFLPPFQNPQSPS